MTQTGNKDIRVLAVSPSNHGCGFVVLENGKDLIDWCARVGYGDKNARCLSNIKDWIQRYQPKMIAIHDYVAKGTRRSLRIQKLGALIEDLANQHRIRVRKFPLSKVMKVFFPGKRGTKQLLAVEIAKRFPTELAERLPKKRQPWMSEAFSMSIFMAAALALMAGMDKESRTGN